MTQGKAEIGKAEIKEQSKELQAATHFWFVLSTFCFSPALFISAFYFPDFYFSF
jgi:hypothetical protein